MAYTSAMVYREITDLINTGGNILLTAHGIYTNDIALYK
jgi:hypothetical protein